MFFVVLIAAFVNFSLWAESSASQAGPDWGEEMKKYLPHLRTALEPYHSNWKQENIPTIIKTPANTDLDELSYFHASSSRGEHGIEIYLGESAFDFGHAHPHTVVLAFCHEIGHQVAGYPLSNSFKPLPGKIEEFVKLEKEYQESNQDPRIYEKLRSLVRMHNIVKSSEGQSDLFASRTCFPSYLRATYSEKELGKFAEEILSEENDFALACAPLKDEGASFNTCVIVLKASLEMVNLGTKFANSRKEFRDGPDAPLIDSSTLLQKDSTDVSGQEVRYFLHPEPQCRIDTLLTGALCTEVDTEARLNDIENPHDIGCLSNPSLTRPRCWYAGPNP